MCLTEPLRVVAVDPGGRTATVEHAGTTRVVLLAALDGEPPTIAPGDWLLVNAGLAVARLDADEATELRRLVELARTGGP